MRRKQILEQPAQQRLQPHKVPKQCQQDCQNRWAKTRAPTSGRAHLQTSKRHTHAATVPGRKPQESTRPLPNAGDDGRTHRASESCGIPAPP